MSTYTDVIKSYSPLGFWRLDEAAGNAINLGSEGSGSDGTYAGSPTRRGAEAVPGYPTVTLNGSSQSVSMSADTSFSVNGFTMIAWIKTTSTAGSSSIVNRDNGGDERPFKWRLNNGTVQFIDRGYSNVLGGNRSGLNDGLPHMLAFTYASNDLKLYADGVLDAAHTSTATPSTASTTALEFGTEGGSNYFAATIGYVAYFTSVLTAAQIKAIYDAATNETYSYSLAISKTPGLVGYWPLDETSGTVATGYGTAGNGTYTNGPVLDQAGPSTYLPKSVDFDGTNDTMALAANTHFDLSTLTAECWFKSDATAAEGIVMVASRNLTTGTIVRFSCSMPAAQDRMQAWNGTAAVDSGASTTNPVGSWHHYVWVWSGGTVAMYDNGVLLATPMLAMGSATNQVFQAGGMTVEGTNYNCNGKMAHVAIYNRALTAAEVLDHYRMGIMGRAGLTVY